MIRKVGLPTLLATVLAPAVALADGAAVSTNPGAPVDPLPVEPAKADAPKDKDDVNFPVTTTRRYGFTMGLTQSAGFTAASGSPIKFSKRDQVVTPGPAFVLRTSAHVGGVFTDWFAFRVGYSQTSAKKSGYSITGQAFELGLDAWPLFWKGGVFRDLGVGFDFATGTASIKQGEEKVATGGSTSGIRGSLFWDALPVSKLNFGPIASFETRSAEVYREYIYTLGIRGVFYGVNKPLDARSARHVSPGRCPRRRGGARRSRAGPRRPGAPRRGRSPRRPRRCPP